MRTKFKRSVVMLIAVLTLGVVGIVGGGASPASASDCNIPGWVNPSTGHGSQFQSTIWRPRTPVNNAEVSWHWRESCWRLGIEGTANQYRFRVWVQDTVDRCDPFSPNACDDLGGEARIQMSTPCAGCTNPYNTVVWDRNSADWIPNQSINGNVWVSPWYNAITNGPANAFKFRYFGTSRSHSIVGWFTSSSTWLPLSITY